MKVRIVLALFLAGLMMAAAACDGSKGGDMPKIKGTPDSRLQPTTPTGGGVERPAPKPE